MNKPIIEREYMNLNNIKSPADIRKLSMPQLEELCGQLRAALLRKLAAYGGHIGPNLGMVEMTVALHYVFDTPEDKIVYDVSHQTYVHKMLTGRMEAFTDPAHYDDVTGFTNPRESVYDLFAVGHTSTAVSMAGGLAKARDLRGGHENVVAVVGDGALSGGEAFEGLDFGATLGSNFIVVVNDNDMSIAENHGGLYPDLKLLRDSDGAAEPNYFKALGYDYHYVAYGNDVASLVRAFEAVKGCGHPVLLHVNTQKGKGFAPAEAHREHFHWNTPFDPATGNPLNIDETEDYADVTAEHLLKMMKADPTVTAITAGTPATLGFYPGRRAEAGRQFVDVGIAEQEAVSLGAGLAKGGAKPFVGLASSFMQRAYDQISQDVGINNLPVVIGIFCGSMNAMNHETHLGWFDIALVSNIPNIVYLAPSCREEYLSMLTWAMNQTAHPVAIRVPWARVESGNREFPQDYSELNRNEVVRRGSKVAIIGCGTLLGMAEKAADLLAEQGVDATVINPRYLSGLDTELLDSLEKDHSLVMTLEDGILDGGYGEKVARYYGMTKMRVACYGLKKEFADRYDRKAMARSCGLAPDLIAANALRSC